MSEQSLSYIAVFDIMGFSSWVKSAGSRKVFDYMTGYFNLNIRASLNNAIVNADQSVDISGSNLGYANFSDTVIFYSKSDEYDAFVEILRTSAHLTSVLACGNAKLVRGGIAWGEFYTDGETNSYIGEALIEAHRIEASLDIFTCALDPRIEGSENAERFRLEFPGVLKPCGWALKGSEQSLLCLDFSFQEFVGASYDAIDGLERSRKECMKLLSPGDSGEISKLERRIRLRAR